MNRFFISHCSEDKEYAHLVKREIESLNQDFEGWVFQSGIPGGSQWYEKIKEEIWASFALLLVVTPNITNSKWVMFEWIFALGAKKTVIPIIFEPTNLIEFHSVFEHIQYRSFIEIDNRNWNMLLDDLRNAYYTTQTTTIVPPPSASPAIRKIIEDLDGDLDTCQRALSSLESSTDKDAVNTLKQVAERHHLPIIRFGAAIKHVAKSQYTDIVLPALREAVFFDGSIEIRRNAISVLGNMGGDGSVEILLEALEKEYVDKRQIIKALGRTKNRNAVLPLSHYLASGKDNSLHDVTFAALDQIRVSIGNITNEEAASVILQGIQNQPNSFAIKAISFVGNSAVIPELAEIYENHRGEFRTELGKTIQLLRGK